MFNIMFMSNHAYVHYIVLMHRYAELNTHLHTRVLICTCIHTYVHIRTHTNTYIHTYTNVCAQTQIHKHTHTHCTIMLTHVHIHNFYRGMYNRSNSHRSYGINTMILLCKCDTQNAY